MLKNLLKKWKTVFFSTFIPLHIYGGLSDPSSRLVTLMHEVSESGGSETEQQRLPAKVGAVIPIYKYKIDIFVVANIYLICYTFF